MFNTFQLYSVCDICRWFTGFGKIMTPRALSMLCEECWTMLCVLPTIRYAVVSSLKMSGVLFYSYRLPLMYLVS
jgi:hypothetical protein